MNKNINMNAARLLGLLQADGNFNFFWEPDGTFRPKIVLTSGNFSFLKDFVTPWLQSQEINSAIESRETEYGVTYNLFVERKTQVLKLIDLLDKACETYPTLLVDSKLISYLALKKAFVLTTQKKNVQSSERYEINMQLADLKIILLEINQEQTKRNISIERSKYEIRLKVSGSQGKAKALFEAIVAEANLKCKTLLKQLEESGENSTNSSFELGEFIVGLIEGDGSLQVGFHQNSKKTKPNFHLAPMLTLTDGYVLTDQHYALLLLNKFFNNNTQIQSVEKENNADRIYIKSRKILEKIVDFLEKRKLLLKKNINRLGVVKEVLAKYNLIYTDIHVTFDLIDQIAANFNLKYRKYSAAECKAIVQRYFDFNKKT